LTLDGANNHTGTTTVGGGTLLVNGSASNSSIVVNPGGILGGVGATGSVQVNSGVLDPGTSFGTLHTGNVTFGTGSTFNVQIGGTTQGSYDQLAVTGSVTIQNGAVLNVAASGGFAPAVYDEYTIIGNDGTGPSDHTGEFASLPEGAIISGFLGGPLSAVISYAGGDGNDVVLTVFSPNTPPIAHIDGPVTVVEGAPITLSGLGSHDAEQPTETLLLEWDLDHDGIFGETGAAATHGDELGPTVVLFDAVDGPSVAGAASLRVTDQGGLSSIANYNVEVINVPPTIAVTGVTSVNEGSFYTLNLGSVADPGADTVSSYTIHWGDGSSSSYVGNPSGQSKTHVYADGSASGASRAITVDLTDEDGTFVNAGSMAITVANVAPTITATGLDSISEGALYTLSLGNRVDPGADTVSSYTIQWGDGKSNTYTGSPNSQNKTHTYTGAAAGGTAMTVSVKLADEDGTFTAATKALTVFGPTLKTWGAGYSSASSATPSVVAGLTNVIAVASGTFHVVALRQDGTVWAWGANYYGQLGDGTTSDRTKPVQVSGLSNIVAIASGSNHSLALRSDGTVRAWGYNYYGQLGDGTTTNRVTPVSVSGLSSVTELAAGSGFSIARRSDGTVRTWGSNYSGQLGDGTNVDRRTPVAVSNLTGVTSIAAGDYHVLALRSDATVRAWGGNGGCQLGDGTTTNRNSPVTVSGLTSVTALAAGFGHSLARRTDGTVRAWGDNSYGQLGDGTVTRRLTPVDIAGLSSVTTVAAGTYHSLALRSDGTVRAWGYNYYGQLGDGTTTNRRTPVTVSGLTGVASVSAEHNSSIARLALQPGWVGSGKAVNGYLVGATAYFDVNKNGFLDSDEPWSTTDATGQFDTLIAASLDANNNGQLDDEEGNWVVYGGTDSSTGLPSVSQLTAPGSWSVVTPLTTLVSTLATQYGLAVSDAQQQVQTALDLPPVDLSILDPISETLAGSTAASSVFAAHALVQDTIAQGAALLGAAAGAPLNVDLTAGFMSSLAAQINATSSSLDLSQPATIQSIIVDVSSANRVVIDEQLINGASEVIAVTNQLITAIPLSAESDFLEKVAQIKIVSQSVVAEQLEEAAQGALDIASVVENNTGEALANQVDSAFTPPTIVIPGSITAPATSSAGASVEYSVHAVDFTGQTILVNCTPPSGGQFPIGPTTVDCSATDSAGHSAAASFTITVENVVTAQDDRYIVFEDGTVVGNVSDNDGGLNVSVLSVVAINGSSSLVGQSFFTSNGTVTLNANGNFTYSPRPDLEASTDSFNYTIADDKGANKEATVFITIVPNLGISLIDGILRIGGTPEINDIQFVNDELIVDGVSQSLASVTEVRIWGRGEADQIDLSGLNVPAFVHGGDGSDLLHAGNAASTMFGGLGDDELFGGNANDLLYGGDGNDQLRGGNGNDFLDGGDGNDTLAGERGDDILDGGSGEDDLSGEQGSDILYGGAGNDSLAGGQGDDVLVGEVGNDTLLGEQGDDVLLGSDGDDQLIGDVGMDLLIGGRGRDAIFGGNGSDLLVAGYTLFDNNLNALDAIFAEWKSSRSYVTRIQNLLSGAGSTDRLNGDFFLIVGQTVFDDTVADTFLGNNGQDWFLVEQNGSENDDSVSDHAKNELLTSFDGN
ncbi:MAG: HYR domain-containing protein, partial [Planctomycetales bacterium]|nr:HYR domain-containing protein [Planctomycetales bacterium]